MSLGAVPPGCPRPTPSGSRSASPWSQGAPRPHPATIGVERAGARSPPGAQGSSWRRCRVTELERAGLARGRPPQNGTRLEHQRTWRRSGTRPSSSDERLTPAANVSIPPATSRAPREIATKLFTKLALLCWLFVALEPNPTMGDTGLENEPAGQARRYGPCLLGLGALR
jgi:hypothetical protein